MVALLTGSDGFVGKYISKVTKVVPFESDGKFIDIRDYSAVKECIAKVEPEYVIHLAGQSSIQKSFENPRETYDVNFVGTFNLLTSLKTFGFAGRLLYVSSGDVYGIVDEQNLPVTEDVCASPISPYAVSKVAAEALCYQWSQIEDFEVIIARPFNHIGPGQSDNFVVSGLARQIAEQMLRGRVVLHTGDIDVSRDFLDVRDVVAAYLALLEKGENGQIYNVCSGRELAIRDIVEKLVTLAGVECEIVQDNAKLRPNEQRRMVGSAARLIEATGWAPRVPLEKTLKETLSYWQENN